MIPATMVAVLRKISGQLARDSLKNFLYAPHRPLTDLEQPRNLRDRAMLLVSHAPHLVLLNAEISEKQARSIK